jgi:hypothetical protein
MAQLSQVVERPRFSTWIVLLGAIAIPLIYLPTLGTRFDFIDDGNLVYPSPSMPIGDRVGLVWQKIVANYEHLGPFRPVLWAHWEFVAELSDGDVLRWRIWRLVWSMFATGMLLALMRELRLGIWPSIIAAALAMWNPYRNEIWTSLTLSEGVAMPYALGALWCAARANRSEHTWPWDLASMLGVLAALGCKNTFAAIVPAQLYLRMYAGGAGWREGWRRDGMRAMLLATTLLLPIGHYIYFRLNWRPGQYPPTGISIAQFGRMLSALGGAMSATFMGAGMVLAIVVLFAARNVFPSAARNLLTPNGEQIPRCARNDMTLWITALFLVVCGIAIYLPIPAISGRYTMPAVWGLDLAFAGLITALFAINVSRWRQLATAGIVGGLIAVAIANVGRQQKFAARIDLLWQTLEYVEQEIDPDARLAWVSSAKLNIEEGIHFRWHLQARGHEQLAIELINERGHAESRRELPSACGDATLAITGTSSPPPGGPWTLRQEFHSQYWAGRRQYDCYLWSATNQRVAQRTPP